MRKFFVLCLFAVISLTAFGRPQTRAVVIDTVCEASVAQLLPVINKFCYQFQACPDSLF